MDFLYFVIIMTIVLTLTIVCMSLDNRHKEKIRQNLLGQITELLTRYKTISVGMDEQEMLNKMGFKYDITCTETGNSYRFAYITKGGSGSTSGGMYGGPMFGKFNVFGGVSGSSETHDESTVTIDCIAGKVTKIQSYNMNNISIPKTYNDTVTFAKYLGIS